MEEWEKIKISDIGHVVTGKTPRTSIKENYGGYIPFLTPSDDLSNKFAPITNKALTDKGLTEVRNCLLPKNSICVSCIGSDLGKVVMLKKPTVTNQQFNSIIPNENYSPDFVYYLMIIVGKRLNFLSKTSTAVPIINKSTFSNFEVEVPSCLHNQTQIAKILSSLDDKIELNNRINANLEEQAQALFRRWFVDFEFPNEQGLPYKSNGGAFVDSELGEIPKGWKIGCIGDYCKVKSGFAFKSNWWTDKGVKVIKIKNINSDNTLNINDCSYVSEDIALLAKDFYVSDGDLLIAMTGATIGKFTIVVSNEKDLLVNQRVGKFFLGEKPLKKLPFIYNALKQNKISETIINKGQGSAQPNISSNDIESIEIPYSSNILIKKFNETCYPLLYQIIHNQKQNMELTQLRDTLLPRLMNNQIKI